MRERGAADVAATVSVMVFLVLATGSATYLQPTSQRDKSFVATASETPDAERDNGAASSRATDWQPLPEFVDRPDPERWLVDEETGLHYRRTTAAERAVNGWIVGSYLVEQGNLSDRQAAPDSLEMLVPYNDTVTETMTLELVGAETGPATLEIRGSHQAETHEPTYYRYRTPASENGNATLLTSDLHWGISGEVSVGNHTGKISGPPGHWNLSDVDSPDGNQPQTDDLFLVELSERSGVDHPSYGTSNNSDSDSTALTASSSEAADAPGGGLDPGASSSSDGITHNYAMIGEGKWCDEHGSNWNTDMAELASSVDNGFFDTAAHMNSEILICHDEFANPYDCDSESEPDCFYADGHPYPFNSCDADAICYAGCYSWFGDCSETGAWYDIDHIRDHGWYSFAGLDVVQVIHKGLMHTDSETSLCGWGYFSDAGIDKAGASSATDWKSDHRCPDYMTTHEFGHNFNAEHCRADASVPTVMVTSKDDPECPEEDADTSGIVNDFSDENRNLRVDPCAEDDNCPRTERR